MNQPMNAMMNNLRQQILLSVHEFFSPVRTVLKLYRRWRTTRVYKKQACLFYWYLTFKRAVRDAPYANTLLRRVGKKEYDIDKFVRDVSYYRDKLLRFEQKHSLPSLIKEDDHLLHK